MNAVHFQPCKSSSDRPTYAEPCLIEEIEVAVRPARVNQAGGRIDEELNVQGLTPSGGIVSIGGHRSYYILSRCLNPSSRLTQGSSGNPLRNNESPGIRSVFTAS